MCYYSLGKISSSFASRSLADSSERTRTARRAMVDCVRKQLIWNEEDSSSGASAGVAGSAPKGCGLRAVGGTYSLKQVCRQVSQLSRFVTAFSPARPWNELHQCTAMVPYCVCVGQLRAQYPSGQSQWARLYTTATREAFVMRYSRRPCSQKQRGSGAGEPSLL